MTDKAIEFLGVEWTYQRLKEETDKVAASLNAMGIKNGDIVVVGLTNTPEMVALILAINKIGAVFAILSE